MPPQCVGDILEVGAQWSIAMKNIPSFERYMAQLKTYYMDYDLTRTLIYSSGDTTLYDLRLDKGVSNTHLILYGRIVCCIPVSQRVACVLRRKLLPESAFKHQLLGLNLLCLLSQNRVAEFHTELELLSPSDIQSNLYIQHPVSLEQFLMEGSYNKVFLSRGNVPADSYNFFLDILLDTVRADIAACMEKAYHHIAIPEAARMLFLQNPAKVKEIAQKRGWKMASDNQSYVFTQEEKTTDDSIPAFELAQQAVEYAKELEMII
ncbi:PSMD8 [Cordylochernes scorpioides]|uniref:PSMD8 n=1 Tax=Cordylochernes scorpioides TaxID=51811 RepID=A0ABY6L3N1_9ARAC|nr:PSMD8 [Cordylochernes scorpioides]